MQKILLSFSLLVILSLGFGSCKKDSDEEQECDITVAAIAGKYKLVSSKYVVGGTETNAMGDLYESCELDDINELKADQTFVYTDGGTVCSPSGSTSGTWNVSGATLILNGGFSVIESFNCQDLVVTFEDDNTGKTVREVYRRQ